MDKNAAQHYREQQILNASPAERIVLLYDGAINFLLKAKRAIEENDIQVRYNSNKKACDILEYLQETLDMEKGGEVAMNLSRVYFSMQRRLVRVDMQNTFEPIDEIVPELRMLRESWSKIANGEVPLDVKNEENVSVSKPVAPAATANSAPTSQAGQSTAAPVAPNPYAQQIKASQSASNTSDAGVNNAPPKRSTVA